MKRLVTTNYSNPDLVDLQANLISFLQQFFELPVLSGVTIQNVPLVAGMDNLINHKLGKAIQGWMVIRKNAAADVYEQPVALPSKQINLHTSADCTVSLYIF